MIGLVRTSRRGRVQHVIRLNRASPFAQGLVGWWPSGNKIGWGSNTLLDLGGFNNYGTLTNGPAWSGDGRRLALSFDGTDDVVNLGRNNVVSLLRDPFSASAWVKPSSVTDSKHIVGLRGSASAANWDIITTAAPNAYGFGVWTSGSGRVLIGTGANTQILNAWSHIVGTWDGTTIRIYLDGADKSSAAQSGQMADATGIDASIGDDLQNANKEFPGLIDDVRVYNRGLSAAEVARMYHETFDGGYGSLAAPRRVVARAGAVAAAGAAWFFQNQIIGRQRRVV